MDHLLLPHDAEIAKLARVPFVGSGPYDGGPFMEYAARLNPPIECLFPDNIKHNSPWAITLRSISTAALEDIFQTWLLFGLVRELLGADLSVSAITVESENPSCRYVSTKGLYEGVRKWMAELRDSLPDFKDEAFRQNRLEHYIQCFWHVHTCLRAVSEFNRSAVRECCIPFSDLITHSIASVGEVLVAAVNNVFRPGKSTRLCVSFGTSDQDTLRDKFMLSNGWCPSQIALISDHAGSIANHYYLVNMKQPSYPNMHKTCTEIECMSLQNDLCNYKIAHRIEGCTCAMVTTNKSDLERAFASDSESYPVLRFIQDDPEDVLRIEVVEFNTNVDIKYVAISHVWADGMGNPNDNAIPQCQLEYLAHITKELQQQMRHEGKLSDESNLGILIDTLTFPTGSGNLVKAAALTKMSRIYENASCVLVLDSQLSNYRYEDLDECEASIRLIHSRWARRIWTLQEGAISKALWIQFKDRAVDTRELLKKAQLGHLNFRDEIMLSQDILVSLASFKSLPALRDSPKTIDSHPLGLVCSCVWPRNCSVVSDQALSIAAVMYLDTGTIAHADPDDRMRALWEVLAASKYGVPAQIIVNKAPRIAVKGFRWAPASLLRASGCVNGVTGQYVDIALSRSEITPQGLRVRFPGYRVSFAPSRYRFSDEIQTLWNRDSNYLYFRDGEGVWYEWVLNTDLIDKGIYGTEPDTLGALLQEPGCHALVLAINHLAMPAGLFSEGLALQNGLYGTCQHQEADDAILITGRRVISMIKIGSSRQMLLGAACDIADDALAKLVENDETMKQRSEKGEVHEQRSETAEEALKRLVGPLARERMDNDHELNAAACAVYSDGFIGFLIEIVHIISGTYLVMEEVYPSTQAWIVD